MRFASITVLSGAGAILAACPALASVQAEARQVAQPPTGQAIPSDAKSIDSIVKALYQAISGEAGAKRDWARFRALFHPDARMIPTGINPKTEIVSARVMTPEDYVQKAGPRLEADGFHETEIARRTQRYGHIAHIFSTYESRIKKADLKPFQRGINSIQLFDDGQRWWVLSIAWSGETEKDPIPAEYLHTP